MISFTTARPVPAGRGVYLFYFVPPIHISFTLFLAQSLTRSLIHCPEVLKADCIGSVVIGNSDSLRKVSYRPYSMFSSREEEAAVAVPYEQFREQDATGAHRPTNLPTG